MKKALVIAAALFFTIWSYGQCPTSTVILTSQTEVDNFAINYPGCTNYDAPQLIVSTLGSDPVTNINGLSGIQTFQTRLVVMDNPLLVTLSGLQNTQMMPGSSVSIYRNDLLSGFVDFLSPISNEFEIDITDCPNLQDLDGLPPVTALSSLRIWDSGISSLSGMEQLQLISTLSLNNNPNLTSLDPLSNVTLTGNPTSSIALESLPINSLGSWLLSTDNTTELIIRDCDNLVDLSGLENIDELRNLFVSNNELLENVTALSNLVLVENSFSFFNNASLTSLSPINNVTFNPNQLPGILGIDNHPLLTSLPSFAPTPFTVSSLTIGFNPLLTSLEGIEGISAVTTGLYIYNNDAITDIDPLSGIQEFAGDLRIVQNNNLINIDGLSGITSIDFAFTDIDPGIYVEDNPLLQNVNGLSNITAIPDDHVIRISDNAILTSLQGMDNLELVTLGSEGVVNIINNPNLTTCNVQSVCDLLGSNSPATISIAGNAQGCDSIPEVEQECLLDNDGLDITSLISLFPNPVSEILNIRLGGSIQLEHVTVYSVIGEELIRTNSEQINMSNKAEGMYFLEVKTNKGTLTKKIVKQ